MRNRGNHHGKHDTEDMLLGRNMKNLVKKFLVDIEPVNVAHTALESTQYMRHISPTTWNMKPTQSIALLLPIQKACRPKLKPHMPFRKIIQKRCTRKEIRIFPIINRMLG